MLCPCSVRVSIDADRGSSSSVEERIAGQDEHDPCGRDCVEASEQTEAQPDDGSGDTQHDLTEDDDLGVVLVSEVVIHPRRPGARGRRPTGRGEDDDHPAQNRQRFGTAVVRDQRRDRREDAESRGCQQQPPNRGLVSAQRPQRGEKETAHRGDRNQ